MKKTSIISLIILLIRCAQNDRSQNNSDHNELKLNVGDIPFDEYTDDKAIVICDEKNILQYYVRNSSATTSGYLQEKKELERAILNTSTILLLKR